MTTLLWNTFFFLITLGILVAVHEYGHFWAARRCGVRVHVFSIGFGKKIWSKVSARSGTEYSLSLIPLGGYVKMLDGRVDELTPENESFAFDKKSLMKRSFIVFAGPLFNFVFALFAYWLMFVVGTPTIKPVIGEVTPYSIAANAGVSANYQITEVNGQTVLHWEDVNYELIRYLGNNEVILTLQDVDNESRLTQHRIPYAQVAFDPENETIVSAIGIQPFKPNVLPVVSHIADNSPAEIAGLQIGDELQLINGAVINSWQQFVDVVQVSKGQALSLTVLRNAQQKLLTLTPTAKDNTQDSDIGYVGVAPTLESWPESYTISVGYGPIEAIGEAAKKTYSMIEFTLSILKKLLTGLIGVDNLGGPISIAKGAGSTADYGLVYFLSFLGLISVNLGIMNLLPLPVLDGGHLLFFMIEAIKGKPLSEKAQELAFKLGFFVLSALMVLVMFNDIMRL